MTDKLPLSRWNVGPEDPAPEADLDAALWPDQPDMAGLAPRPVATGGTPPISARGRMRMERDRRARKRRRVRVLAAGAGVLVLAAATVAVANVASRHGGRPVPPAPFGYTGPYAPVTLNADNSVTMARPGVSGPVLDVYEDFQCQACRAFEKSDGAVIQRLAFQGKVKVVYYPYTASSSQPELGNSVRAWAAARCVPPGRWVRYHNLLYANQPTQAAAGGFSVSQLIRLGRDAGITGPGFAQCVRSQRYAVQDAPLSDQIINAGVGTSGLPSLTLDGHAVGSTLTPSALRKLIQAKPEPEESSPSREGV